MITSLVGTNSFLLSSALKKRRKAFIDEYGNLAVEVVDVSEWEPRRVFDCFAALPFLSPKRMVIMRGLSANKAASEQIEKLLQAASDSTEIIIVESKIDKRSVLYKTLKKSTTFSEFADGDMRTLPTWLVTEAKARGGHLSMAEATYLVSRVGPNQQMLSSELDKLQLYQPVITRATINLLTERAPQSTIFDLIEAAFSGNLQQALALYEDQRQQNVEPLAIEALFVWQLHALALCKAAGQKTADTIAAESGISLYVAKKSLQLANSRTLAQIKNYVFELAELEQDLKSTSTDADERMKNFIVLLGQ